MVTSEAVKLMSRVRSFDGSEGENVACATAAFCCGHQARRSGTMGSVA